MSYLIVGAVELITCITIIVIISRPLFQSTNMSSSYFIPIYVLPVCFLLTSGLVLAVESIMQMFHVNVVLLICNWFLIRALSEAAVVFLMQHGIGRRSAIKSAAIGVTWSMFCGAVLLLCFYFIESDIYWLAVGSVILLLLTLVYAGLWLLPLRVLHRRPACSRFAMLTFALTLGQFIAIGVLLSSPRRRAELASSGNASSNSERAVMLVVAVTEFAQVLAVLHALHVDSLFWQGLYSDASANLNHPLAGAWDNLQSDSIQAAMRHTISSLERRVVPIIPYSHLAVDTGKYFSGGSARVYRGRHGDEEVAVKILFCIELTPARVVDFCNEATLLNSLRHPNLVRCCGVAIMPPAIALVTEFCAYGSLYDFLHFTELHHSAFAAARLSDSESFSGSDSRASSLTRGSLTVVSVEDSERLRSFANRTSLQHGQSLQKQQQTERGDFMPDSEELVRRSTASSGQFSVGESSVHRLSETELPRPGSSITAVHANTGFPSPATTAGRNKFSFYGRSGGIEGPHLIVSGVHSPAAIDKHGLTSPLLCGESGGLSAGATNHALRSPSRDVGHSEQWAVAAQLAAAMTSGSMSRVGDTGDASSSSSRVWGTFGGDGGEEPLLPSYSRKLSRDGLRRKSSRMRSASRVLASSEMGFGLGPRLAPSLGAHAAPSRLSQRRADCETGSRQASSLGSRSRASSTGRQSTTSASVLVSVAAPSVHSVGRLLPASTRLRMARDCCAGLAFLHSEGLLHCDVKSLNFLVSADLTVKLADLGEARLVGRSGASPEDTRDVPLNINWSSPELLRRHCGGLPSTAGDTAAFPVTQASDVWSLAMVVAELLSGEVPFDSPRFHNLSLPEFAELITETGMRPAIPSAFAQLSWLSDLLNRAWNADPTARCTAAQFLDTFDANLQDINNEITH